MDGDIGLRIEVSGFLGLGGKGFPGLFLRQCIGLKAIIIALMESCSNGIIMLSEPE